MTKSTYGTNGDVAVLTLSNPPANLFTLEVGEDVRAGVQRAREEGARAMVIQADGAVLSGGADVSLFKDRSLEEARDLMIGFMPILAALEDAPFPVLAAVHGLCFAAGLELALACDLIIAAEGTQLAQVEALIGATTFGGGVYQALGAMRAGPGPRDHLRRRYRQRRDSSNTGTSSTASSPATSFGAERSNGRSSWPRDRRGLTRQPRNSFVTPLPTGHAQLMAT